MNGLGNNISGLSENVNGLNENVDGVGKNVESLFTRIGELDNGMQTNLTTLQQTFAKQFGDLNVSVGQNTEELKSYLEELNNGLKQDMNQVFTSVSNGKKKLASALLTKGVSTNEDATFAQLAEAILNIDQKLVIGVEEIPGTIRYQYHYHVDASGNQPHTEKSDTAGGCYTGTHGHVHRVEDGCYKEESYHVHRDDCIWLSGLGGLGSWRGTLLGVYLYLRGACKCDQKGADLQQAGGFNRLLCTVLWSGRWTDHRSRNCVRSGACAGKSTGGTAVQR